MTTTNTFKNPQDVFLDLKMSQKQIEKMALIERRLNEIICDKNVKGKIVIFVDPNKPNKGFIERIESIIISKD